MTRFQFEYHDAPGRARTFASKIKHILEDLYQSLVDLIKQFKQSAIPLNGRKLVIQRTLGEGGFSFVYLVKDKSDGRLYALKHIRVQLPEHAKQLSNEIETHAKVNSPNVIKLIDSKIVSKMGKVVSGYLLLPYYPHGTVQDMINMYATSFPFRRIVSIGIDICKGLAAFHSHSPRLAYRDLKVFSILTPAREYTSNWTIGWRSDGSRERESGTR